MDFLGTNPLLSVFTCLRDEHDPRFVLLSLLVCLMTATATVLVLRQAVQSRGIQRRNWALLAGTTMGFGAWATHFVALLGYHGGATAGFLIQPTLFSLALGFGGSQVAMICASIARTPMGRAAIGLLQSGVLAVMHYTGMTALAVPATMHWNPLLVTLSVILPAISFHRAVYFATRRQRHRDAVRAGLTFLLGIAILHYTAMGALELVPAQSTGTGLAIAPGTLAGWIGAVTLGIFSLGIGAQLARHRSQTQLLRSQRQFSILVRGTSDYAICLLDCEGRISQWNAGAHKLLGYRGQEVIDVGFERFFTPEDRSDALPAQALKTAREAGLCSGHWICQRRDGSRFWAHGTIEKLPEDPDDPFREETGFSLILRDVTQFKQAQDIIAQTSRRLDTALENMHEGLCLFDAEGKLVLTNRRFRELWQIDEDDCAPGTSLEALIQAGFLSAGRHSGETNENHQPDAATTAEHFRQLATPAGSRPSTPEIVEFGEDRVLSITTRPAPDGGWVTTCTDITEQRRTEARIAHMALHDALTGLPNRTRHYRRLDKAVAQAASDGTSLAVVAIDLDRFKEINDTHGHAAGDLLLKGVAARLCDSLREGEFVARLGGDEFAAAKSFTNPAELDEFLHRLNTCVTEPVPGAGTVLGVGASLGIAIYPVDGEDRETLLNNADLAMYRAKATLGTQFCFFEMGMDEIARERRKLAGELRQAIAGDQLFLLYQPQRSLRSGKVCGYEALLRWRHPERGLVSPDEFVPLAEENGEILAIGEWVLREACREAASWEEDFKVAINLSAVQFLQPSLVDLVRTVLLESGLPPRRLELEITETAIISDKLRALHCLRQIKAMGVSVAIDDFGTGYSSLDTLHSFPFDKIKIDKSFLLRSDTSEQARAIVRAVLALGHSLHIPVLAEGVESESHLKLLESEGCDEAQGYYFGRPDQPPKHHHAGTDRAMAAHAGYQSRAAGS